VGSECGSEKEGKKPEGTGVPWGGVSGIINVDHGMLARHEPAEAPEAQDGDSAACRPPANPNIDGIAMGHGCGSRSAPKVLFLVPPWAHVYLWRQGGLPSAQTTHQTAQERRQFEARALQQGSDLRDVDIPAGGDRLPAALVPSGSKAQPTKSVKEKSGFAQGSLGGISNGPCLV
jgi:hypothetical protein